MYRFSRAFTLNSRGFTLIELLIVIGILAVLATTAVIVLNPTEFMKKSRDATRFSDLATINKAISLYQTDGGNSYGSSTAIYVSIPDSSSSCANLGLPSLPAGYGYICADEDNYQKADGDGWIPVDFTSVSYGTVLNTLPVDPTNTVATGQYYTYTPGGSWKLAALMESEKYSANMNSDGGPDLGLYELGSNLSLKPFQRGLVGYWKFDEGSGTTATDSSGNGNNGTLTNGPTWISGQVNGALSFDGVDDIVIYGTSAILNLTSAFTLSAWVKPANADEGGYIVGRFIATNAGYMMRWAGSGDILTLYYGSSSNKNSSAVFTDNNVWVLATIVFDTGNVYFYRNGIAAGTGNNVTITSAPTVNNTAGNRDSGSSADHRFNGLIDDVRIYNRALSASEIKSIYDATK